ncbi:hypothetical protein [Candidatus Mycoplasma haematohominis]|uniref:hypothetical protein n=1 Tax=Candidatus Mycoplasma haematohominis TaxID=1494318 RepID=UPI001C0A7211|nr:hypothetical protein [Candidatus Mycoplasma haemohominis]
MGFNNSDDYRRTEEEIILYINKYLELDFTTEQKYLEFNKNKVWFRARPNAITIDQNQKITSVLSIKSQFLERALWRDHPYWSHVLQLSLYLFLAGIDQGYLCLCQLSYEKEAITEFKSQLEMEDSYLLNQNISYYLRPKLNDMQALPISYQITEVWKNNHKKDTPLTIWKIKINFQQFSTVIDDISEWWDSYLTDSPELTKKEKRQAKKAMKKIY